MATQKRYIAITPNKGYFGKTCGVRFEEGRALVDEYTIDPFLGWTVDQVADKLVEDFGYAVTEIVPEPAPESKPKAKRKTTKKRSE